jgi:hypothetical protein
MDAVWRVHCGEQVHMVGHYLKLHDFGSSILSRIQEDAVQPLIHAVHKNGAAILRHQTTWYLHEWTTFLWLL